MIKNNNNKIFYTYLFIFTLWCLPFLLYQDFYRDDYTRLVTGYAGWENAGRPLATLLYHFLSMDFGIIHNLYPLPLFLSVFILAYTFYSLHKHIKKTYDIKDYILLPSILIIVCNPFYIQNLAYQYDILPMCIALSLSIFAFIKCNYKKSDFLWSVFFIFIALNLYQPVINVFITFCIINMCFPFIKSRINKNIIYIQTLSSIFAVVLYYLLVFILSPIKPLRSAKISLNEIPDHFINNINNLSSIMDSFYLGIITLIVISALFYIFWVYYSWKNNNKILSVILPFMLFIFIWGPLLILKEEMTFPRTYLTVGILFGLLFLFISHAYKYLFTITYVFLSFSYFILISFCYTQNQQFMFEKNLIGITLNKISEQKELYSTLMIFSYGGMPESPNIKILKSYLPYLNMIQKPSYRWEARFKMAILGYNYTNSMYTYTIADNSSEWDKICKDGLDDVFSLKIKTDYSDVFYDKNKKYTSIWFRNKNSSVCDNKPLNFDAE